MWKDKCSKCGQKIFNGIPEEHKEDILEFIKKMESEEGYIIGYNTKIVGEWGNSHDVPIKPICKKCSQKTSEEKEVKEMKKAMNKIAKILKKEFSCPICEYETTRRGYDTKIFKCTNKQEMMNHIKEKHNYSKTLKEILPCEGDY